MRPAASIARPLEARIVKILLVNYEFPPVGGGAANATAFLSRALVAQGHAVTVLTAAFGAQRGTVTEAGVEVVRVRTLRRSADRSNPLEMLSFLLAALIPGFRLERRRHFDASIAFFTIPSGPISWMLSLVLGVPYLVSLRGGDVPGFVPEIDGLHRLIKPLRRAVLARARYVVANSPSLARLSASADPVPVDVIPNGVDPLVFAPQQSADTSADDAFHVLFVGRLHSQKNVAALIESAAALAALPGPRIVVEIVGDGPERPALAQRAEQTGAAALLRWHGWLGKQDVLACYRRAHAFVNPSLYEGMPNTVLEAMACALPVVASRIGGNEDLVVEGETGFLFDLATPQELTAALQRLRLDPRRGRDLGRRGRQRVIDEFSWESVAARYVRMLAPRTGVEFLVQKRRTMLRSNLEYIPLRLLRRFVFRGSLLQKLASITPYYEVSRNEVSSDPIVAEYARHLAIAGATLQGTDILEVGSGRTNSVGRALARAGARQVTCYEPHAGFDAAGDARLLAASGPGAESLAVQVVRVTSLAQVADASVDLVLSSSVLEHVRDLRSLMNEVKRVLRPSGAMLHLVDYRDHFFKYPFHFLQFSGRVWDRFLDPGDLPRWRLSGQVRVLEEAGFRVEVLARDCDAAGFAKVAPHLASDFDAADPEIAVTHAALFARSA